MICAGTLIKQRCAVSRAEIVLMLPTELRRNRFFISLASFSFGISCRYLLAAQPKKEEEFTTTTVA
jgi:hypothetical protein